MVLVDCWIVGLDPVSCCLVPVYLPPGRGDLLWCSSVALRPPNVGWRYIMNNLCVITDFRVNLPCVSVSLWGGPCGVLPLASNGFGARTSFLEDI